MRPWRAVLISATGNNCGIVTRKMHSDLNDKYAWHDRQSEIPLHLSVKDSPMTKEFAINRRAFLQGAQMMAIAGAAGAGTPLLAATTDGVSSYYFDTPYNRIGSDCTKWDAQIRIYGKDHIAVGMGIADMDFRVAPCVTKALADRVKHENWGYLDMPQAFPEAVIAWNKRHYGIDIHPDWLKMSTGVHPSIVSALQGRSPRLWKQSAGNDADL